MLLLILVVFIVIPIVIRMLMLILTTYTYTCTSLMLILVLSAAVQLLRHARAGSEMWFWPGAKYCNPCNNPFHSFNKMINS